MGFGLPAAIGGCLASGQKLTVTVDGDGGFQMNIQELETVARLKLPIKYFVLNNQGYGSIRSTQRNYFGGHLVGCDSSSGLSLPDPLKQAQVYGMKGITIRDHLELRAKVREVLGAPGPVVCEVKVDPDQPLMPRASSVLRSDGSMVTKPLEDLWPFLDRDEFYSNMIVPTLDD